MLNVLKKSLRITTDAFDQEIAILAASCIEEMVSLGVIVEIYGRRYIKTVDREYLATILWQKVYVEEDLTDTTIQDYGNGLPVSPQVLQAVIAYCKWQFGNNEDAERWERIYHEKLAQLKTMTGFTEWEV